MTDAVTVGAMSSLAIIVVSFLSRLWLHQEHKANLEEAKAARAELRATKEQVTSVELKVDGRLTEMLKAKDELLEVATKLAKAQGAAEERTRGAQSDATFEAGVKSVK